MRTSHANIFIAHSPFQYLLANHMVNSMKEFSRIDNYLILDSLAYLSNPVVQHWREIVNLSPPVGGSVIGSGNNCRKALSIIKDICSRYKHIKLFRANLEWPLNNAAIGLTASNLNLDIVFCNYPEGIGSLVYNYPTMRHMFKTKVKHILGLLGGSPFFSYKGDIMGLESSDHVYSLLPSALKHNAGNNVTLIPILKPHVIKLEKETCIFIGQNYGHHMSLRSYTDLCERAASYTHSLGYSTLLYKPHHYEDSRLGGEIFTSHGFSIVEDKASIEQLFLSRQYACAVSFTSSALVNLKLMFSNNIRCIACFSNLTFKYSKAKGHQYRELYKQCGVEMYD